MKFQVPKGICRLSFFSNNVSFKADATLLVRLHLRAVSLEIQFFSLQQGCPCCTEKRDKKLKRKRKLASAQATAGATPVEQKEEVIEDGASPAKRSRVGRTILVPRRFRDEPEGRQH